MKNLIEELEKIKNNNYLIIVEGKKDRDALNSLGLKNILTLENKPLYEIVESIKEKDIVILTDLDIEGKKLFNKLRYQLQRNGKKMHNNLRIILSRTNFTHIEGLDALIVHKLYKQK